MAAYGASRGDLNRDGNQNSATDDYPVTPDQRFSQSLITEGQKRGDFTRHTMDVLAWCDWICRVSSEPPPSTALPEHGYVHTHEQIATIITKCQLSLSGTQMQEFMIISVFSSQGSRSFSRARNCGKMCWEELKFKSRQREKVGVTTPSEEIVEDAVRTIWGASRARCPCTARVCDAGGGGGVTDMTAHMWLIFLLPLLLTRQSVREETDVKRKSWAFVSNSESCTACSYTHLQTAARRLNQKVKPPLPCCDQCNVSSN